VQRLLRQVGAELSEAERQRARAQAEHLLGH